MVKPRKLTGALYGVENEWKKQVGQKKLLDSYYSISCQACNKGRSSRKVEFLTIEHK